MRLLVSDDLIQYISRFILSTFLITQYNLCMAKYVQLSLVFIWILIKLLRFIFILHCPKTLFLLANFTRISFHDIPVIMLMAIILWDFFFNNESQLICEMSCEHPCCIATMATFQVRHYSWSFTLLSPRDSPYYLTQR